MTSGSDLALAIALPVGIVALIGVILVASFCMARKRRDVAARTEPKTAHQWNEDRDEVLDDREWLPLEAGWRDPSQSRLSSLSFQSNSSGGYGGYGAPPGAPPLPTAPSMMDINNNGFAYRPPPPPPVAQPPMLKTMTPMTERKRSGISVPATIGERDETVRSSPILQ